MPATSYLRKALAPVAARMENAYNAFVAMLSENYGLTNAEAVKAFGAFKDAKALKYNATMGTYTVKHGAFLDRPVVLRAAGLAE